MAAMAVPPVVAGSLGTLAAVMALSDAAPVALVLFPGPNLPEGTAVLSRGRFHLVVEGAAPGLARNL